jgi:hypothetical protein
MIIFFTSVTFSHDHMLSFNYSNKRKFDVHVTVHRRYYVQHIQLTALRYTTQTAYRFGHQEAVLTLVLLKKGILMLETC